MSVPMGYGETEFARVRQAASACGKSADAEYQRWTDECEPTERELAKQREACRNFAFRPVFSVIVPVYQVRTSFLQGCIRSVLAQTYDNWELFVAYAPGGDELNLYWLRSVAKSDERIRLLELEENGGISRNSNAALNLVRGDFVAFLDHDDTLAPFALFEAASALQAQSDADILYSDHDYLDSEDAHRKLPLFKPDWSPEIMLSANYITHLTMLRRRLLEEVGEFDPTMDGAQDWDLFLRASLKTDRILHIPKILYHWRMHPGSTAHNDSAKPNVVDAQLRSLGNYLQTWGVGAEPQVLPNGLLYVRIPINQPATVSIIIPTKNKTDLLSRCISSLLEQTAYENFEILLVDNGTRDSEAKRYLQQLSDNERIRVIWYPGSFNYSAINNMAAREARGEFLLFLNNDVEFTDPEWLTEMVMWAQLKPIGIVGAKLLRGNGSIQHLGVVVGMGGFADHPFADEPTLTFGLAGSTGWYRNFLAVTGACMMMRREVFNDIGGFDEQFIVCGSDVEICLRARRYGYRVVCNPFAELIHHEQQTRGRDVPAPDYKQSFKHYGTWLLKGDPYWNPNLSLWSRKPSYRRVDEQSSLQFCIRLLDEMNTVSASGSAAQAQATEEQYIAEWFDCTQNQLEYFRKRSSAVQGRATAKSVLWFVPAFENPFYGGAHTILRFAEYWRQEKGVKNLFAICGGCEITGMADRIRMVCQEVNDADVFHLNALVEAATLPATDAGICTFWTTAYYALHHRRADRYFYLIQDHEPSFYKAGSASAAVETTYRMGLYGIANTISLKKVYETEFGGKAIHFTPCVNDAVFYPAKLRQYRSPNGPWVVFLYGRPGHSRNSFELLSTAMKQLKGRLGKRVRIVSAGSEWEPAEYGLQGIIENLGLLSYEETAQLYRESDVGAVMMLTRHPSYIPLELMASGCLVVTNINSWTSWLLKDNENCLLSKGTASAISETVHRGLVDAELRQKLTSNALEMIRTKYLNWRPQMEKIYEYLCDPESVYASEAQTARALTP